MGKINVSAFPATPIKIRAMISSTRVPIERNITRFPIFFLCSSVISILLYHVEPKRYHMDCIVLHTSTILTSSYASVTLRKFFFPLFNTMPSPCSFSFAITAFVSVTFSPSTETPPCSTARRPSERDGTRPVF